MPRAVVPPRRRYAAAALLMVAGIVYGSLYPLDFSARNGPAGPWQVLIGTWPETDHGADLLANLIFYFPLGVCLIGALPGGRLAAGLAATLFGAALSCAMELLQFYVPGRETSLGDVEANGVGTALGAIAGAILGPRSRFPLFSAFAADPPATLVLGAWVGARCYPYVPEIDLHKYWVAVRGMLLAPAVAPLDLLRYAAAWLAVAAIVERVCGFRRWLWLFPAALAAEAAARVAIHGTAPKLADLAGGGCALLAWGLALRRVPGRLAVAGCVLVLAIVALRLEPFAFGPAQKAFGWIPLLSLMEGSMNVAIQAFLEKIFFYGAAVYLIWRGALPLAAATALVALLLLATSFLEVFLPDRSAEVTDAVLAVVMGLAFACFPAGRTEPAAAEGA